MYVCSSYSLGIFISFPACCPHDNDDDPHDNDDGDDEGDGVALSTTELACL